MSKFSFRNRLFAVLFSLVSCCNVQAGDSIHLVRIDSSDRTILKIGETIAVTVRYRLESVDKAKVNAIPFVNNASSSVSYSTLKCEGVVPVVTNEGGEATITLTLTEPTETDHMYVYLTDERGRTIAEEMSSAAIRWVDPKFANAELNPVFQKVPVVYINKQVPGAEDLHEWAASNGIWNVNLFDENIPRVEILFRGDIVVPAAQAVLTECTKHSEIALVSINESSGASVGRGCYITVGCADLTDCPPMPRKLLDSMIKPGLTLAEFCSIPQDWIARHFAEKDGRLREAVLMSQANSALLDELTSDFGVVKRSLSIPTNGLIAYYEMNGNGVDSSGKSHDLKPRGATFTNGTLYMEGFRNLPDSGSAEAYVPLLEYTNFTAGLDFYPLDCDEPTAPGEIRRDNFIVGGVASHWWFNLECTEDGNLQLLMNDESFKHEFYDAEVLPRSWNRVVCAVDFATRSVRIWFNGKNLEKVILPAGFKLDVVGSRYHLERKRFLFTNDANCSVMHGYIDNLIVYDHALSDVDLNNLVKQLPWH